MSGQLTVGSLFSGIGGLELGLERTGGFRTLWQCEIDPYCRAVLARHWPGVPRYRDIRDVGSLCGVAYKREEDGTWWGAVDSVDVICGGFPCQPVSVAGKGLAQEDPRWLWPEFARVVGLLRPRYVIVENVPGLRKRGLADVVGDLAALGYDAEWNVVSAASVGAPHLRKRIFLIAHAGGEHLRLERGGIERQGWEGSLLAARDGKAGLAGLVADAVGEQRNGQRFFGQEGWSELADRCRREWPAEPPVGRVVDEFPGRVAELRGLGNSVVPSVARCIGELILAAA